MTELPAPFRWDGDHVRASLPGGEVLFTTRRGGVSNGPYASLNLGPWTDDHAAHVDENRDRVEALVGLPVGGLRQVHASGVCMAQGPPVAPLRVTSETGDALLTCATDVAVSVLTADCLPIALVSPTAVGAVHAGWRGLAGGVVEQAVRVLRREIGDREPIAAAIGPGARGCCYEVGDDVRDAFTDHGDLGRDGRRIDLPAIARRILTGLGVETVHDTGLCSLCAPEGLLFSHRRDGGDTGRQMGIAWRS